MTRKAHAKRLGRTQLEGQQDADPNSHFYYGHSVGQIVEINGEFLHVEKVEREPYRSGEGDAIFGYNTYGVGHFVPQAKAEKLRVMWAAKERIRVLELELRVARQGFDYGGNPYAVPGLEAELAEARKLAGL